MIGDIPDSLDINRFDAVGIHYTLHLSDPDHHFLSPASVKRLEKFQGLKCIWLHDEYRRNLQVVGILRQVGIDVIFSLARGETLQALYPKDLLPNVRLETVLAGYLDAGWLMRGPPPTSGRPVDVGYRARRPPFWLGALGQEKINIGEGFKGHPATQTLVKDISVDEQDRIYGEDWPEFLARCKAVLCVESGASIIDFTGEIEQCVESACKADRSLTFSEVSNRFLKGIDGKRLINPISPRVLEAAAMRCVMVAFPGEYSGMMQPWKHYIPLSKDFSNLAEVVDAIRNAALLERIAQQAWEDLACAPVHSYSSFAEFCSRVMDEECVAREHVLSADMHYTAAEFRSALSRSPTYLFRQYVAQPLQALVLGSPLRGWLFRLWYSLPPSIRTFLKPALKVIGR